VLYFSVRKQHACYVCQYCLFNTGWCKQKFIQSDNQKSVRYLGYGGKLACSILSNLCFMHRFTESTGNLKWHNMTSQFIQITDYYVWIVCHTCNVYSIFVAALTSWTPLGWDGQAAVFYRCGFSFFFFLSFFLPYSQRSQIGCVSCFWTWCGLSANLECRSEMCFTRLAENTGRKNSPSVHHRTTLSGYLCN